MAVVFAAFSRVSAALAPRAVLVNRWANAAFGGNIQLPPKRPPNAYILFMKDRLAESRDLEPDRSYKDLFRHIGTMWSNLSDIEKERYRNISSVQLQQWGLEYEAFLEGLPDREEYLRQLKALRGERRKCLKSYRERKQRRLERPPRKLSAYNIYFRDQLAGASKEEVKDRFVEAAQSWKALSEDEKAEYESEAKQIHEHEMEEYNRRSETV